MRKGISLPMVHLFQALSKGDSFCRAADTCSRPSVGLDKDKRSTNEPSQFR